MILIVMIMIKEEAIQMIRLRILVSKILMMIVIQKKLLCIVLNI